MNEDYDLVIRMRKDIAEAAATLSPKEARYLVDTYYTIQEHRIAIAGQIRAMGNGASVEPHAVLDYLFEQMTTLEHQAQRALDIWTRKYPPSVWARSVRGIGPVLAAGLRAHIDVQQAPTVGHIWRFAGLDPTSAWNKGEKRPWNARLKVLCWKIGESFVKTGDFYRQVYDERKVLEIQRNEAGAFAEQAAAALERKRYGKETTAKASYTAGCLPPAHIHARARRHAVKLFLAHYWEVLYRHEMGKEPPLPYPIANMPGHSHYVAAAEGIASVTDRTMNRERSHDEGENHTRRA